MTWTLVYFVTGLCMGSFLALCADRLPMGESPVFPPSHCDCCGHRLGVPELVPVAGYLFSAGHCRYCGQPIPSRFLWRELTTGLLFLAAGWGKPPDLPLFLSFVFLSGLLVAAWIDWDTQLVYDVLLMPLMIVAFVRAFYMSALPWSLLGFVVMGCVMGGIYLLARGGMGLGDVKLCLVLGLWLGAEKALWCLFLASLTGSMTALTLIALGRRTWKEPLPFAPFLCSAAFWLYQWGEPLMQAARRFLW